MGARRCQCRPPHRRASCVHSPADTELTDSQTTFRNLGKFLSITNLPALKTLQLRGWLDATNAKTVALAPLNTLPSEYLELWGLLGILRNTGVVELRLQNSVGHPDELVECVFRRADRETPEWEKRLATFW